MARFKPWLTTPCVVLLACLYCLGQQTGPALDRDTTTKIDRYVQSEMSKQKIPGVSLAILRNGKISLLRSYGLANVEHQVPVKPETVFQSGSLGKQFTAAAVMILVEQRRIALGDRISKYFPDTPPAWKDITVWNLLTHTSGLGDYPDEIDLRRDYTEAEYFEHFKKTPLHFPADSKWDYSNIGYVILGALVRKVTGKFYGDFLQEQIFKPLGMTRARIISEEDIVPNRAAGYRLINGALKNQQWVSPSTNTTADGSLYLSILDLAKWDAALYTDKPLKQSSLRIIWTPATLSDGRQKPYGFGWFTDMIHNRRILFHGGAWQGFKTFIVRFPEDKLTIIFLANSWDTKDFRFARGLAAIFYPEFELPSANFIDEAEPKVSGLIRRVLLQLQTDTADANLYTDDFRAQLFPAKAREIGEKLNALSLPIAVISLKELVERHDEGSLREYHYLLTDIGGTLSCRVKLARDDKIAGLDVVELK